VLQSNDRNLFQTEEFGGLIATMTGNYLPVPIDQDRCINSLLKNLAKRIEM